MLFFSQAVFLVLGWHAASRSLHNTLILTTGRTPRCRYALTLLTGQMKQRNNQRESKDNVARIVVTLFLSSSLLGCGGPSGTPSKPIPMTIECATAVKETSNRYNELILEEFSDRPDVSTEIRSQLVEHRKRAYWAASDYEFEICKKSTNWKPRGE
jgi:hypothetical protein